MILCAVEHYITSWGDRRMTNEIQTRMRVVHITHAHYKHYIIVHATSYIHIHTHRLQTINWRNSTYVYDTVKHYDGGNTGNVLIYTYNDELCLWSNCFVQKYYNIESRNVFRITSLKIKTLSYLNIWTYILYINIL